MKILKTILIIIPIFSILTSEVWSQKNIEKYVLTDEIMIKHTSIKNQQESEICWSFAVVSFLESEIMRKGFSEIDLSEMYYARQLYIQRGIDYVRYHGNLNFGNGGQSHDVLNQLNDLGIIPQQIYVGNNYNPGYMNLAELNNVLKEYLDEITKNPNRKLSNSWKKAYLSIIDTYLGEVPSEFIYNNKSYTPVNLCKDFDINADDYIEITSFNHHPFYEKFVLEIPDNWSHNQYYNVPLSEFFQIMKSSIEKGYGFVWNGDVLNDGFFYSDISVFLVENLLCVLISLHFSQQTA